MRMIMLIAAAGLLLNGCQQQAAGNPADAELQAAVLLIEQNLLDWARQNGGLYPEMLGPELLKDAQNKALLNPYDGTEMHPVAFTAGELAAGNICYIAVHEGAEVQEYVLLGFGEDMAGGQDVDGDGKGDGVIELKRSSGVSEERMRELIAEMK
ncbi:MAG: hypothetical protein R3F46_15605 [bacterium]